MGTTSKYKICRRLGPAVYEKCQTQKFVLANAKRGKSDKRPKQISGYGMQLIEKQRTRFAYGISEKQLRNYVLLANASKHLAPTEKLFDLLERRLDNVVYRLGLAGTRALARQMTTHGHIFVNGTRVKVPAYLVSTGDVITIAPGSKKSVLFTELDKKLKGYALPQWLSFDLEALKAVVVGDPKNNEGYLHLNTVLEFYSR